MKLLYRFFYFYKIIFCYKPKGTEFSGMKATKLRPHRSLVHIILQTHCCVISLIYCIVDQSYTLTVSDYIVLINQFTQFIYFIVCRLESKSTYYSICLYNKFFSISLTYNTFICYFFYCCIRI